MTAVVSRTAADNEAEIKGHFERTVALLLCRQLIALSLPRSSVCVRAFICVSSFRSNGSQTGSVLGARSKMSNLEIVNPII